MVHNGIIENFAELRAELEAEATSCVSETDTEVAAHLLERELDAGADLTTAMQSVCRRLEGAFTLVAVDAQDPSRVVAARRNSPLVVGLGEGENFLGSDVAAFIEHTREALELGQDQVVTITRDGVAVTDFDGKPAEGKPLPRRLGPLGRREGRLRLVHAQGDLRAAARGRRLAARAARAPGALQLDEMRLSDEELRDIDKIIVIALRHGVLRRPGREVRHRALDPDPVRGRAAPTSSATATRS